MRMNPLLLQNYFFPCSPSSLLFFISRPGNEKNRDKNYYFDLVVKYLYSYHAVFTHRHRQCFHLHLFFGLAKMVKRICGMKMTNKRRRTNEYSAFHRFRTHRFACFFRSLFSLSHTHYLCWASIPFASHSETMPCIADVLVCCSSHNYVIALYTIYTFACLL